MKRSAFWDRPTTLSDFQLNEEISAGAEIKADDQELRLVMRDMALAALADDAALGLSSSDQLEIMEYAGLSLLSNQDALTQMRSGLGYTESRIEYAETENAATRTSLSIAHTEIVAVDSTEVASQFQAVEYQLEMVYAITARLNSMSLMDYM